MSATISNNISEIQQNLQKYSYEERYQHTVKILNSYDTLDINVNIL